ncbi:MAG: tRNA-dihydrouridine synthase family protein [Eubacteriales bacterium]|nr:tRNA-dihydrouridine synthase family protein [Eubacteriales bacterium]
MADYKLYAAPLEGLTTYLWRRIQYEMFGGADQYFTPFLSPNSNFSFQTKELDDLQHNEGMPVVPQILCNRADHFLWAARELYEMGYREINFNLGCPSGTVTAKRKGAGFLAYPDDLNRCLGEIFDGLPTDMRLSVKTRIGKNDPAEWEKLLTIYNQYPISELIVHCRVQKEFYRGAAHTDAFAYACKHTALPLVYNGDLHTVQDVAEFCELFPETETLMLGRGLIADPSLLRQIRGGAKASREELTEFHKRLLSAYRRRLSGDLPVLHRMREFWNYYAACFEAPDEGLKQIRKARNLSAYCGGAEEILRNCALR